MKKFNVELTAECNVYFSEPEKAIEYFINGDWRKSFFDFDDLEDLAGFLAKAIISEGYSIEGFSDFRFNTGNKKYESIYKEYGIISIEVETDLDIDCVTEQEQKS